MKARSFATYVSKIIRYSNPNILHFYISTKLLFLHENYFEIIPTLTNKARLIESGELITIMFGFLQNLNRMKDHKKVGKKIKEFREFRTISREDLALKANLDIAQLEMIEEKGQIPSLGHLIKISRAFGVRIGTFLDDQENIGPSVVKAGEDQASLSFSTNDESSREHLNFFSLAPAKAGRHMEPFIVKIEPAAESDFKLSSHEGEEFIFVLEGSVEINYGKDVYELEKGDSIYLDSIVTHNVHAAGEESAKILAVVYTPV